MPGAVDPPLADLIGAAQYRVVPSRYPPVDVFESIADPGELELIIALEGMTNPRLLEAAGDISLVPRADRLLGPGSTPVMAAFTHIGQPSRFTAGGYGIYYAALDQPTALRETVFHRERFLTASNEPPCEIEMRMYAGKVARPLHDIRGDAYRELHAADLGVYPLTQRFGQELRARGSAGLLYPSARNPSGNCLAAFKPVAVSIPAQSKHFLYRWDGARIVDVLRVSRAL
jgi:hypothetical protein